MNKRKLRKTLRKVINDNVVSEGKIGYGTGNTLADFSDHIMNAVQDAIAAGYSEEEIRDFFYKVMPGKNITRCQNAVEAGLQ